MRAPRSLVCALACAAATAASAAPADDPASILLALLPVEAPPGLGAGDPLRITLLLTGPGAGKAETLRGWFPTAAVDGDAVTLELAGRAPPAAAVPPAAAQRAPSFFVDYDEPAAAPFRAAVEALGAAPSPRALEGLVDGWIARKSMGRALDPASRVARRREGDCSEHAVLLAAAARLAGRPSRIVLGIALLPAEGQLRGSGHAWVELHDGAGWRIADATPLPAGVRYVPLSVLSDEGPAYAGAAWAGLSPLDVRRIVLAPGR